MINPIVDGFRWQQNNNPPNPRWFLPLTIAVIIIISLLISGRARGDEAWTDTQIVNAIWKTEGGTRAVYAYGIRSVKYSTIAEARRICFNTVRNNRRRYAAYGHKQFDTYLEFLASRYCPTKGNLSRAEKRLNGNWIKNVRYFLERGQ